MEPDDRGINDTRAHACEIVAWRFLSHLSEPELVDYLLYELPTPKKTNTAKTSSHSTNGHVGYQDEAHLEDYSETSRLLSDRSPGLRDPAPSNGPAPAVEEEEDDDPTKPFVRLNALEIAAVADAKRFLSQRVVQKVVNGIWHGDIIFWDSMNVQTQKKARKYNHRYARPPLVMFLQEVSQAAIAASDRRPAIPVTPLRSY